MQNSTDDRYDGMRLKSKNYFFQKHNFDVKKQTCVDFPLHWHDFFELEVVLEGNGTHYLNGDRYEVCRGSVYLLSPVDYHKVVPSGSSMLLWNIMFDESVVSAKRISEMTAGRFRAPFVLSESELDCAVKLIELLAEEKEYVGEEGCFKELFESLLCHISRALPALPQERTADHDSKIKQAISYLEMHFRESPSLSEIAAYVGYHPMYFCKLFKKVTGVTYNEKLNRLRIDYSKKLLAQGVSVSEACYACGFGSLSNFQHIFRKQTGCAPSRYSKK